MQKIKKKRMKDEERDKSYKGVGEKGRRWKGRGWIEKEDRTKARYWAIGFALLLQELAFWLCALTISLRTVAHSLSLFLPFSPPLSISLHANLLKVWVTHWTGLPANLAYALCAVNIHLGLLGLFALHTCQPAASLLLINFTVSLFRLGVVSKARTQWGPKVFALNCWGLFSFQGGCVCVCAGWCVNIWL